MNSKAILFWLKVLIIILFSSSPLYSQEEKLTDHLKNPKGKLFLKIETDYRITPIKQYNEPREDFRGIVNEDV